MKTTCDDMPISPGWICCRGDCKKLYNGSGAEVCRKCEEAKCPPKEG